METSDLVRQILRGRGIESAEAVATFLHPDYEAHSHDPLLLADMDAATTRIEQAIEAGEAIAIYGDYDIDGLSATALLLDALTAMGGQVSAYIPDRFEEGYGLNTKALQKLKRSGAQLVITVDCGSVSYQPLAWAADNGLDVIVTDHHTVGDALPQAIAVINPKRADNQYPFTDLAGVGVAFKLVQALQQRFGLLPPGREKWLLDLVALGTVCDVVGLVDENRMLVTFGLKVFARTHRVGLRALAAVAGVSLDKIDSYHFGFVLGPRLNAAGRLEHAKLALQLFTTQDKAEAIAIAQQLDELNTERRRQQDEIFAMALEQAKRYADDPVLVLSHETWNHGIVGIVAAKILERFGKPTIVLQEMGDTAKGSARSLGSFSTVEALRSADEYLGKYGGHHVAAGASLRTANIPKLRQRLNDFYQSGSYGDLTPSVQADVVLTDLTDLTWDTHAQLQQLAPFGMGNPRPLFALDKAEVLQKRVVGGDGRHLKLTLGANGRSLPAIAFGQGEYADTLGETARVCFELDRNDFRGSSTLQLLVKELE